MTSERSKVKRLYVELCRQQRLPFPQDYEELAAPSKPGVYVIRNGEVVLHVGRTLRGKKGLHQRLKNHLYGSSSFTKKYLKGNGAVLRKGHSYQFLVVYNQHYVPARVPRGLEAVSKLRKRRSQLA